jgi:hypothetical protein
VRAGKSGRQCRLCFSLSEKELRESWAAGVESRVDHVLVCHMPYKHIRRGETDSTGRMDGGMDERTHIASMFLNVSNIHRGR